VTVIKKIIKTKTVTVKLAIITTATRIVVSTATPTVGRNGIATPVPAQPNMVANCQAFYYVRRGETCDSIAQKLRVSSRDIIAWNPNARADCTLLFAEYFACVGLT